MSLVIFLYSYFGPSWLTKVKLFKQAVVGGLIAPVVAAEGPLLNRDGLRRQRAGIGPPVVADERRRIGAVGSGLCEQGCCTLLLYYYVLAS